MTTSLPQEVLDLALFHPIEDLLLAILRAGLPGSINVQSLVADQQDFPLVLTRRAPDWGVWGGDARFVDGGTVTVNCFCAGIDADSDGALLSEAIRVLLVRAINTVVPDLGHLTGVEMLASPSRKSDWGNSTGPVQYADLPAGVVRYETTYGLGIKAPRK